MTREISPERKAAYYAGMCLSVIGFCLFTVPFFTIAAVIGGMAPFGAAPAGFGFAIVGFILLIIGRGLMTVGKSGLAGAGIILDPERARQEQEPFSRMGGGILHDTLDEAGLIDEAGLKLGRNVPPVKQVVMIRCRNCGKLNEEDSKFCQECGREL
jgi:hypothetical protein